MSTDITNKVLECGVSLERRNSNPNEPLISHDIPDYPWETIATDLFTWNNQEYLLVVDYYSRYFEVEKLHKTTNCSQYIIEKMKKIFSRHGIPRKVDNCRQWSTIRKPGFFHICSGIQLSPCYFQS
ncbi:uncharacterized protein LOC134231537 [Saccostrea cucullata]|uniref:uncharacterized protein LOC134231537 n=1 Tax=Saccostrea cuccullata TaxID=36930 RepID=UPI002ED52047